MALSDHKGQYKKSPAKRKFGIMELNTKDEIIKHNKLLTQTINEMTKKLSKILQQFNEMHEIPKHRQIEFYDLCSDVHPISFCPSTIEEFNYIGKTKEWEISK